MNVFKNISIKKTNKLRLYDATKKDIEKYGCIYGDVFFTASSETPNEIAMSSVWLSNELVIFNGFCKRFRFDKTILLPKYASYLFRGNIFRNKIKSYATRYTRYNISQKDLENISIFILKIFEQQKIIDIIEPIEKCIYNLKK